MCSATAASLFETRLPEFRTSRNSVLYARTRAPRLIMCAHANYAAGRKRRGCKDAHPGVWLDGEEVIDGRVA